MKRENVIPVTPLGQAGFRYELGSIVIFVDPYLSNYVEEAEGPYARRMFPIVMEPSLVDDADWVLITHAHIDHCDPKTVVPISIASPECRFIAPSVVCEMLIELGVDAERIFIASESWFELGEEVKVRCIPAAHPTVERDKKGLLMCVGYLINYKGKKVYHSGDTSVDQQLISELSKENFIDIAFISVNEKNYYRDKLGIIGNMSLREAFEFAEEIHVKKFVPMHWDMFELNCVYREEIELMYEKMKPTFEMHINPSVI